VFEVLDPGRTDRGGASPTRRLGRSFRGRGPRTPSGSR